MRWQYDQSAMGYINSSHTADTTVQEQQGVKSTSLAGAVAGNR